MTGESWAATSTACSAATRFARPGSRRWALRRRVLAFEARIEETLETLADQCEANLDLDALLRLAR